MHTLTNGIRLSLRIGPVPLPVPSPLVEALAQATVHHGAGEEQSGFELAFDLPLDPRYGLRRFSDGGFEWSYEGPEPEQLAFALLVDHLGDPARAASLSGRFMREVVANFDNEWEMTSADIDRALGGSGAAAR